MMYHHHGLQTTFTGAAPLTPPPRRVRHAACRADVAPANPERIALAAPGIPLTPAVPLSRPPNPAPGNYDEYFGMATDVEAVVYLMLVRVGWWGGCARGVGVHGGGWVGGGASCWCV